jgi:hypothetical protein
MTFVFRHHSHEQKETPLCVVLGFTLYSGLLSCPDIYNMCRIAELENVVANPNNWGKFVCLIRSEEELQKLEFLYLTYLRTHHTPIRIELEIMHISMPFGEMLRRVGALETLVQSLDLVDNGQYCINDRNFEYLTMLPSLESVRLHGCNDVTNYTLECLAKLQSLKNLSLSFCSHITGHGLENVFKLPLQSLKLISCANATSGIRYLPESLTHLTVNERNVISSDIVRHLIEVKMPNLRSLDLGRSDIMDDDIAALLDGHPNLQSLSLGTCNITGNGLKHIAGFKFLQSVCLLFCRTITGGLVHLSGMRELQVLYLYSCNITNEDAECLAGISSLRELGLIACREIRDRTVEHLATGLKFLKILTL